MQLWHNPNKTFSQIGFYESPQECFQHFTQLKESVKNSILTSESQVNSLIAQEVEGLWYLKVIVVTVNTCLL